MPRYTIAAWTVHLYTASGGVIGLFALLAAADGQPRLAFCLLLITALIDSTDGLFARGLHVKEHLPNFDGAAIDNVIDVLTYVWVPTFIMATEDLLPHRIWIVVPTIAAMYAYGQVNMKTEDSFFLGFPSYWNVIALYLFWLRPDDFVTIILIAIPSILTFIPTRYLYPSKNQILWKTSWGLGLIWLSIIVYLLLQESPSRVLILISLYYPVYYVTASFLVDWHIRRGKLQSTNS